MHPALRWAAIAAFVLAARLAHLRILWIEECYPAAAAIQVLRGLVPYRDFFFDKPPLAALFYISWGGLDGWPLRLAGVLYVLLSAWLIHLLARRLFGEPEAWCAAFLLAFFFTFAVPSAAMALAPDLLLIAPHLAAVLLAVSGAPLAAGFLAAIALGFHTKGIFVLAACLLAAPRSAVRILGGFSIATSLLLFPLFFLGALDGYWQQVWAWGFQYAAGSHIGNPIIEGLRRTAGWAGFHAAAVAGAAFFFLRQHVHRRWMLLWLLLSLATVAAGGRFFPRYYFFLLPVVLLAASHGLASMPRKWAALAVLTLLIPLARFGPRYVHLHLGGQDGWTDLAMFQDSRRVSEIVRFHAAPGDTLLVWGYRPDVWMLTRLKAGTPFLDSQPLTGVLADRHLMDATPSMPNLRSTLIRYRPEWIVDGLGPYNRQLAITNFPDLRTWLDAYTPAFTTSGSVVYRRKH